MPPNPLSLKVSSRRMDRALALFQVLVVAGTSTRTSSGRGGSPRTPMVPQLALIAGEYFRLAEPRCTAWSEGVD
jgi:hypothetical protein